MIARPVDSNGDMIPVSYASQMLEDSEAVAQIVRQRLQLYFGEWWEDEITGFRVPQFLTDGVRHENVEMLVKYISSYVAGTDGVTGVTNAEVVIADRKMIYSAVIHTGTETVTLEVELDGILSTEY